MSTKTELESRILELAEDALYQQIRYKELLAITESLESLLDNLYSEFTNFSITDSVH